MPQREVKQALATYEPYSIRRSDLPDGHPLRGVGRIGDELLLREDDTLVAAGEVVRAAPA